MSVDLDYLERIASDGVDCGFVSCEISPSDLLELVRLARLADENPPEDLPD